MASPSFGSPYHSVKFHDLVETVEDWRLLVLGMWVEERLRRSGSLDLPWLNLARAQTLEFDRCQSWSLTSVALGYEPADADWPMLLRFKSLTPFSSLRSMPVVSLIDGMLGSRKRVASLGVGDHVWRRRVVTQWLRTGRAVLLALRDDAPLESNWLMSAMGGSEDRQYRHPTSTDAAESLLDAVLQPAWRLRELPVLAVEVGPNGPLGRLPSDVLWSRQKRTVTLGAVYGHLVVTGCGIATAVRSGASAGTVLRAGTGHGDALRLDSGHGSAVRVDAGHGCAFRLGLGDGCSVREGAGHGDAVHDSVGGGGALHVGSGVGSAWGGFAVLRGGLGAGDAYTARSTALRTGFGAGSATTRGPGRAERHGIGSGDAWLLGRKEGTAINTSAGSGDAVNHGAGGDARREGVGSGCAWVSHAGVGTAERSGDGSGSASRTARFGGEGNAVRSGDGTGIANYDGHIAWGRAVCGNYPLMMDETGWFAGVPAAVERLWDPASSADARRAARKCYVGAPSIDCPVVRVRVARSGVWTGGRTAGVRFDPERNLFVLDSSSAMTLHVSGAGHANVLRTGSGAGDAVRSGTGYGNVQRLGKGNGSAIRRDSGAGDALRSGSGLGHAWVGPHALGNALVSGSAVGWAVQVSQCSGSALNDSTADGGATRVGRGSGDALRRGSGNGDAQRGGGGVGNALRAGSGSGTARRWGIGSGNAVNASEGDGDAWRTGLGSGDGCRRGSGKGHAGRLSLGSGLALRDGSGAGDALVHPFVDGEVRRTGSGSGAAGALALEG